MLAQGPPNSEGGGKAQLEEHGLVLIGESEVPATDAVTVPDRFRCEVIVAMLPAPLNPLAESALEAFGPKVFAALRPLHSTTCGVAARRAVPTRPRMMPSEARTLGGLGVIQLFSAAPPYGLRPLTMPLRIRDKFPYEEVLLSKSVWPSRMCKLRLALRWAGCEAHSGR